MSPTDSLELLERETELAGIESAIEAACAGSGTTVLVEGPAGIGKTALLGAARDIAAESMTVLSARATQLERDFPFGVARQLLEPPLRAATPERRAELLSGAAGHAAPALGLGDGGSADPGFTTLNGLYWLVCDLAAGRPLMLLVDDAHWADRDSLRFLAFLAPRLSDIPVLLVVGARPHEWPPESLPAATASDPGARAIALAPLSPAASTRLIESGLGVRPSASFAAACHDATGGNPFYLRALVDEVRADGVTPDDEAVELVLGLGPEAVVRVLVARLGSLCAAAPKLVRAVTVLGDGAEPRHCARLAGIGLEEARAAAAELSRAAILEPGEPLRFAHPIIRNAVYEDIGPRARAELHARAVEVLGGEKGAGERIPGHLLAIEPAGRAAVVATLRRAAADALARGALDTAVAYLRRALEEPPVGGEQASVMLELGRAEAQSLDPHALARLEGAAEAADDSMRRVAALAALGLARYLQGDVAGTTGALREALALIPPGTGGNAEAYLLLTRFLSGRTVPELVGEATALLDTPRAGAGGEATPAEVARLLLSAFDAFLRGDRRRALERLGAAVEQLGALGALPPPLPLTLILGSFQGALELHEEAASNLGQAFERARTRGSPMLMALALESRVYLRLITGDLAGAIADAETRLRLGGEDWEPATTTVRSMLAICLVERGDTEAAARALELPGELDERIGGTWGWLWLPYARAHLALARGELGPARDEALEAGRRMLAIEAPSAEYMQWRSLAAVALARLEDRDRALELAAQQLELARAGGSTRVAAGALTTVGIVIGGAEGIGALREAALLLEASSARLERARALIHLGAAIRQSGGRAEARAPLDEGMALARECGAAPLAERAYAELRATGMRPRRPDHTGVQALTPSELRVARMAADGLSNREIAQRLFVTVKTVEFHLGQTYRKLEISSREELPGVL